MHTVGKRLNMVRFEKSCSLCAPYIYCR